MADGFPPPESVVEALRQLARPGLHASRLAAYPELLSLRSVQARAVDASTAARAVALEELIGEAVNAVGGSFADALRAFLALEPGTRGRSLEDRRSLAGRRLGIQAETFRKREIGFLSMLAHELIKLELESIRRSAPGTASRRAFTQAQEDAGPTISPLVAIREARPKDRTFVFALMTDALSPFYGGDHRAHAERIFTTHVAGGRDEAGHFSTEQRMFIATVEGRPAGMIHLVAKRQRTYKISPLIVDPAYRSSLGLGSALLLHALAYARERGSRQIYCTVAEDNEHAVNFFLRNGFIVAGRSASHYKPDATEMMLYRPLDKEHLDDVFDRLNISVLPFDERKHATQVRELILQTLPACFMGVDDTWVDSLFAGYQRRVSGDVNIKYKLLYVAVDRDDTVLGLVGATPKKGEPIKLMPFVATSQPGFVALLADVPFQLREFGRKIYMHISPSVDEVLALQQHGWHLDSAMPAAYHEGAVTFQWSLDLTRDINMRTMRVKERFLSEIVKGRKTLEVRVGYDTINRIRAGECIALQSRSRSHTMRVSDVRRYASFAEMLDREEAERIAPGSTKDEVLALLQEIYPPKRERLGVVVLELEEDRSS